MKKLWITAAFSFTLLALPGATQAQQTPLPPPAAVKPAESTVSLDLRDAPLRQALEQLFTQAKVDFVIDPSVTGYATLKITDQPFETALRLLLRASAQPFLYTKEGGVYVVKPRVLTATRSASSDIPAPDTMQVASVSSQWEVISMTYLDPADLKGLLNIINVPNSGGRGSGGGGAIGGTNGPGGNSGAPGIGGGIPGLSGGAAGFSGSFGSGLIGLSGGAGPSGGSGAALIAPPGGSGLPGQR